MTSEISPFERVWRLVRRVPRGKVVTYGLVSLAIDRRLTPVGVGWAVRAAKEGSIPWHRVVNAQGGISTDREHPGLQRAMLEAEGVRFGSDGRIDLSRHQWQPHEPARRPAPTTNADVLRHVKSRRKTSK
jgi:methylated-DNA-protein-cysteine methyltransferase-like protein